MEGRFEKLLNIIRLSTVVTHSQWLSVFKEINKANDVEKNSLLKRGANIVWYDHEKYALRSYFVDMDLISAKQHFYLCGMLDIFQIKMFDLNILSYGINHFTYALLSDNREMIESYASLSYSHYEKDIIRGNATPCFIMQCIIKEDWGQFTRAMGIMKEKTLKKYPVMRFDMQCFEGIAEKNKQKVDAALGELLTPRVHSIRNKHHILLNEFISHPALGYAKLAWLKGIEVEVNNPLVPAELLPVRPLEKYVNEYEFLNEIKL